MGTLLKPFSALLRFHKKKMLGVLAVALLFFFVLFPMDDLADFISMQVARASGVYVQFQNLGLGLSPGPSVHATDVIIEPVGLPPIKMSSFQVTVAMAKALMLRRGLTAQTEGLFKSSSVNLVYGQGSTTKGGDPADDVTLSAEKLNLDDLFDYLRTAGMMNFRMQGNANVNADLHVDHAFVEQPSGTVHATLPQFVLPSQGVMLDMNGVMVQQQLPTVEFGNVTLDAKLNDGVMNIESLKIGGPGKEINGSVKGTVGLQLQKNGPGVATIPSNLDVALDLTVDKAFLDRNKGSVIGGFLMLMDQYKQETSKGTRYAIRLQMKQFTPGALPLITKLGEKI